MGIYYVKRSQCKGSGVINMYTGPKLYKIEVKDYFSKIGDNIRILGYNCIIHNQLTVFTER